MICRWLMFICTKSAGKNAVGLRGFRSRFCSPAPGEVVLRRLGNRQEAGRSAAADKDRIHLQKWITLSLFAFLSETGVQLRRMYRNMLRVIGPWSRFSVPTE